MEKLAATLFKLKHTHTFVYSLIKTLLYVFLREIWVVLDVNNLALEQVMVVVSGILCFWQAILIVPGEKKKSNWFTEAIAGRKVYVRILCFVEFLPKPSYQLP